MSLGDLAYMESCDGAPTALSAAQEKIVALEAKLATLREAAHRVLLDNWTNLDERDRFRLDIEASK